MQSSMAAAQNDLEQTSPMPRTSAALLQEELLEKHKNSAGNHQRHNSLIGDYHNSMPSASAISSGQHSSLKKHKEQQMSNAAGASPTDHSRIVSNQYANLDFGPAMPAIQGPPQASAASKENSIFRS